MSLSRRFFRLTFYNILANVTAPLVGLVDVAMLGHLGDIRFLAGVALGGVIFDVLYWTLAFLRMGTTGTTAQVFGRLQAGRAGEDELTFNLRRFMLLAAAIAGLLLTLRSGLGDLGFGLLSGEPKVEAAGREYYDARILGVPAVIVNLVLMGWFLGREQSGRVLLMTAVANLTNIALNYLLIVRFDLAARGAGLASAASQYLMLALAVWLYARDRHPVAWNWSRILNRDRWARMAHLNRDILIRTLLLVSSFAIFTNVSSILGVALLAANTLLLRILNLAALLIDGAAFAAESLAGVLYGGNRRSEMPRLMRLAVGSGLAFTIPFLLPLLLMPEAILGLLTSHADVVALGATYRWWMLPVLVFGSVAYIHDGIFLGLTAGRELRNAMFISTLTVFLPLALMALRLENPNLLWLAFAAFMLARAVTLEIARRALPAFTRAEAHG